MSELKVLKTCKLFAGIAEAESLELLEKLHFSTRNNKAGSLVIQSGDDCDYLIILSTGRLKAEMMDSEGHVVRITDMYPPSVLAPAFLFGSRRVYPVNVTAYEDSETVWIPRSSLLNLLMQDQRILINYLNVLSDQGQFLAQKVHFHAFNTLREKVLHYFSELYQVQGRNPVRLESNRESIAEFFGVARPSLSRVMSVLQDEGMIEVNGKEVLLSKNLLLKSK